MSLSSRVGSLEREVAARGAGLEDPWADDDDRERTDEEEADSVGEYLWLCRRAEDASTFSDPHGYYAAWDAAVAEARARGHAEYHAGLRPFAMPIWLDMKPDILRHRRTHGHWVETGPEPRLFAMSAEEWRGLQYSELLRLYLEAIQRPGYWSRLGPGSAPKCR
jgi:hypothetical protein